MSLKILQEDITKLEVDAIVNAANTELLQGGGVCGAIFKVAGPDQLQEACSKLAPINTGEAVITKGFNLSANYIIHAVGPVYSQWSPAESKELLQSVYLNSLKLAVENQCESIAFPLISSGIYGYPKKEALQVAIESMKSVLEKDELDIYLTIIDKEMYHLAVNLIN